MRPREHAPVRANSESLLRLWGAGPELVAPFLVFGRPGVFYGRDPVGTASPRSLTHESSGAGPPYCHKAGRRYRPSATNTRLPGKIPSRARSGWQAELPLAILARRAFSIVPRRRGGVTMSGVRGPRHHR